MTSMRAIAVFSALMFMRVAGAENLLTNGSLDVTYEQEIIPGFFMPKPAGWFNEGFRSLGGPFEQEMSSEPWAGPAPTPVTELGVGGLDFAAFFKPFSGVDGPVTAHLYQEVPSIPGQTYLLSGWIGAESNALIADAVLALEFFTSTGSQIGASTELSVLPTLFTDNGEPFDYKHYSVIATAPAGAAVMRARFSMIGGAPNPQGGGQALVADDFELRNISVPEPSTLLTIGIAIFGVYLVRRNTFVRAAPTKA